MIRQNLGKLDRVLRFILAFWLLGPLGPRYWHCSWANTLIVLLGVIALIESFVGYCPLMNWIGVERKD